MITTNSRTKQGAQSRQLAEKVVEEKANTALEGVDAQATEEIRLTFHELSVYQIELERQNEELRQIRDELDRERARYQDLYDFAPVGYCALSNEGLILKANLTVATMLGVSREALINQPLSRFIHVKDQDVFYLHNAHNNGCDPQVCELRMVKEDGAAFWVHLATIAARRASGSLECRLVISDITEHKRAEMALKQSERRENAANSLLKLVLDTIPVRLFWKDLTSTYLGCNHLFAQDAGFEVPEELIGLDDYSMGWREQADQYRQEDFEVMSTGKPKLQYEEIQTTPDGQRIWISTSKVPLRDIDDQIIGVLGSYEDITQRKRAEEELLKTQKIEALGLLAGGIAHDFNNILMIIMGNISLVKQHIPLSAIDYERLTTAETAAWKAKNIAQQMLTFSKENALVKHSISVANLVKEYGRLILSGTKSTCAYSIPDNLWRIEADEGQIGQALTNILLNADQSAQDGGTISINCENVIIPENDPLMKSGRYVKIAIKDQGKGIPEEHLDKIFDPYFTTKEKGSGLGLASSYSIVKKHGGYLTVQSTPKSGSTFTFFLPASLSRVPEFKSKSEESITHTSGGKILVMDDDELLLDIIGTMLEKLGYEAELAQNGEQTIEKYIQAQQAGTPFDAVIMDLIIPAGMGGKEAMERLQAIDPHAKVIISSGYSNNSVLVDYERYGFSEVIEKPYRLSDLRIKLEKVVHNEQHNVQH